MFVLIMLVRYNAMHIVIPYNMLVMVNKYVISLIVVSYLM